MPKKPRTGPTAPDGDPKPSETERAAKSKVPQIDALAGGGGKPEQGRNADEAAVDEAAQLRKKPAPVDLLH